MDKSYNYELKTFINARHAVRWEKGEGAEHPHTWELVLDIKPNHYPFDVKFEYIENVIEKALATFSGQRINDVTPFDKINPTIENFADYLFDILQEALQDIDCCLTRLIVGESPTRLYTVHLD